jgi:hypothetical protein
MTTRLGIRGYLEASQEGLRLYEQCGFVTVRDIEWDTRPWGGDHIDVHYVGSRNPEPAESNECFAGYDQTAEKTRGLAASHHDVWHWGAGTVEKGHVSNRGKVMTPNQWDIFDNQVYNSKTLWRFQAAQGYSSSPYLLNWSCSSCSELAHVECSMIGLYLGQIDVWNYRYVQSGRGVLLLRSCVSVRVVLIPRELARLPRL